MTEHIVAKRDGYPYTLEVSRDCMTLLYNGEHIETVTPDDDKWGLYEELCRENNIPVEN